MSLLNIYNSKKILQNQYLVSIMNNTIKKETFIKSQEPFIHCVNYWSQILGLLVFKLDDYKDRRIILENLYDEHFGILYHMLKLLNY